MMELMDTVKEPVVGLGASVGLSVISLTDITAVLQLISVSGAVVVAILTAYLTVIKIRKEKDHDDI